MSRALERWFGDALEAAFPETDEQRREREAAEEFGELIAAAAKTQPKVDYRTDVTEPEPSTSPYTDRPLNWSSDDG